MVDRDYATQSAAPKRRAHAADGRSRLPGWLWALCGLTLGLCFAAAVFIVYRPLDDSVTQAPPAAKAPQTQVKSPAIPPQTEARFKFYDLLPKFEVKPSQEPYKPDPSAASTAPQVDARYLIQAGSFRKVSDAERRKATIALLGLESTIQKVQVEDKGTYYRVQIGPAMDYRRAEKAMRQLADNDIDSFATRSDG